MSAAAKRICVSSAVFLAALVLPSRAQTSLDEAYHVIASKTFVDLTHAFGPDTPVWSGFGQARMSPAIDPKTHQPYTIEKDGFRATYYEMAGQYGTHIDPPAHFAQDGITMDKLPLKQMILPLVVFDASRKLHPFVVMLPPKGRCNSPPALFLPRLGIRSSRFHRRTWFRGPDGGLPRTAQLHNYAEEIGICESLYCESAASQGYAGHEPILAIPIQEPTRAIQADSTAAILAGAHWRVIGGPDHARKHAFLVENKGLDRRQSRSSMDRCFLRASVLRNQNHTEPCFALHHASVSISSLFERNSLDHRADILEDAEGEGVLATVRFQPSRLAPS
jgi:hypothetical protein